MLVAISEFCPKFSSIHFLVNRNSSICIRGFCFVVFVKHLHSGRARVHSCKVTGSITKISKAYVRVIRFSAELATTEEMHRDDVRGRRRKYISIG